MTDRGAGVRRVAHATVPFPFCSSISLLQIMGAHLRLLEKHCTRRARAAVSVLQGESENTGGGGGLIRSPKLADSGAGNWLSGSAHRGETAKWEGQCFVPKHAALAKQMM